MHLALLLAPALLLTACGGSTPKPNPKPPHADTTITLNWHAVGTHHGVTKSSVPGRGDLQGNWFQIGASSFNIDDLEPLWEGWQVYWPDWRAPWIPEAAEFHDAYAGRVVAGLSDGKSFMRCRFNPRPAAQLTTPDVAPLSSDDRFAKHAKHKKPKHKTAPEHPPEEQPAAPPAPPADESLVLTDLTGECQVRGTQINVPARFLPATDF